MSIYLSNAFSLSMIAHLGHCDLDVTTNICNYQQMVEDLKPISVVGHEDTANLFSNLLGMPIPMNRVSITLNKGDTLIVGQYSGARLPEGTSVLPEGASITWTCVHVE